MTFLAILLTTTLLAQLTSEIEKANLEAVNRQADLHIAAYELDKAEPLLEQALDIAARLGPLQEITARSRLTDLYLDQQKRDGRGWMNIALPHLIRAYELATGGPPDIGNQLAAKLALIVIQLSPGQSKPDLAGPYGKFLERWIGLLERTEGPLSPRTAISYQALMYSPYGSEGLLHAQNACDVLGASTQIPAPEFAALLIECAEIDLPAMSADSAIREARAARAAATAGGPRYAYETALAYVVEGEAELSLANNLGALSALDSASDVARKSLSPAHPIWDRIRSDRAPLVRTARPETQRELVPRPATPGATPSERGRIQPAKAIKMVEPAYTKQARAEKFEGSALVGVLITSDGKGKVFNTFRAVPYGLNVSVQKAIGEWAFQPWTKDGKPVAGMSVIEVTFRLKN